MSLGFEIYMTCEAIVIQGWKIFDQENAIFSSKTPKCQMSIKYELIIYWSEQDSSFIVEVPELSGCIADGQTYQEAVSNAEVVIEEWLETAKDLGRPIPKPKGRLMYA